jgi:hypothetical protein
MALPERPVREEPEESSRMELRGMAGLSNVRIIKYKKDKN